jgi:hypothetical protein
MQNFGTNIRKQYSEPMQGVRHARVGGTGRTSTLLVSEMWRFLQVFGATLPIGNKAVGRCREERSDELLGVSPNGETI